MNTPPPSALQRDGPSAANAWKANGPVLLDDRTRPDFGDHYLRLLADAARLRVAASRIRLGGLRVDPGTLESPARLQVLLTELSGITMAMEADRMAEEPAARSRLQVLVSLLEAGRLEVRSSPLGGWNPDFSLFTARSGAMAALVGPHWLDRPWPHRGPALASLHHGDAVVRLGARFDELWEEGHLVSTAVRQLLGSALERSRSGRG